MVVFVLINCSSLLKKLLNDSFGTYYIWIMVVYGNPCIHLEGFPTKSSPFWSQSFATVQIVTCTKHPIDNSTLCHTSIKQPFKGTVKQSDTALARRAWKIRIHKSCIPWIQKITKLDAQPVDMRVNVGSGPLLHLPFEWVAFGSRKIQRTHGWPRASAFRRSPTIISYH